MNRREKILAAVTGLFVAGFLVYIIADQLILAPFDRREAKAQSLREQISDLREHNRAKSAYRQELRKLAGTSFGTDEVRAANNLVERLKYLLNRSGLSEEPQSLSPVTGTKQGGTYKEIGQSGRASGTLKNAVDFLYLVKHEPGLHRLENVVITPKQGGPREEGGRVDLQFKYTTLVLERPKGFRFPTTSSAPAPPRDADLDSDKRRQYNVIVARDLFRPYIKRPVIASVPPPPVAPPRRAPVARQAPLPPPPVPSGRFKVVDLSTWADQQEVVVRDTRTGQTRTYKPGAPLASGKIVMVDYRQLPRPDKPYLLSPSRVIIQIGPDYWAIELGQSLADKRRLTPEQLPDGLRAGASGSPAPEAGEKDKKQT